MTVETISIALICTIVGCAVGLLTFSRNKAKDDRNEGQQNGQMLTELGYIKSGSSGGSIRRPQRSWPP